MEEQSDTEQHKAALDKVMKKMLETKELTAEAARREAVALEKFYGWLIEWIQIRRQELQSRKEAGVLLGITARMMDFRTSVMMEFASEKTSDEIVKKLVELYDRLRGDIYGTYYEEDKTAISLPHVSSEIKNTRDKIHELYICSGQLMGFLIGRMIATGQ